MSINFCSTLSKSFRTDADYPLGRRRPYRQWHCCKRVLYSSIHESSRHHAVVVGYIETEVAINPLDSSSTARNTMETGDTATLPMGIATPSLVRPNTLLPPEKEPVHFQINLIGAPPEVEQLIEHIKAVAEQFLYHWKTFPISE